MNYIPHTEAEWRAMLDALGVANVDDLFEDVPEEHRFPELNLSPGISQMEAERRMRQLAEANTPATQVATFLGAGAYHHYVPAVVDSMVSRGELFTAYTPYQPEMSQGTLQSIFEFQSCIAALAGMDVANASLYDGGTALAEALLMSARISRRDGLLLADSIHPAYRAVVATYVQGLGLPMATLGPGADGRINVDQLRRELSDDTACVAVGYPNFFGIVEDLESVAEIVHGAGALLVVAANPIALALLPPPGDLGADIAVAEGQPLGLPLGFGGPYLGLLATSKRHMRQMPGRVVGEALDAEGRRGYVMTLRAREQDIRREKATSNICTNQALAGLVATVYMAAMGKRGMTETATQCYHKAHYAFDRLTSIDGVDPIFSGPFFHEFALRLPAPISDLNLSLLERGIVGPFSLERDFPDLERAGLFCVTEMNSRDQIDELASAVEEIR